jgi:hypothetical protein
VKVISPIHPPNADDNSGVRSPSDALLEGVRALKDAIAVLPSQLVDAIRREFSTVMQTGGAGAVAVPHGNPDFNALFKRFLDVNGPYGTLRDWRSLRRKGSAVAIPDINPFGTVGPEPSAEQDRENRPTKISRDGRNLQFRFPPGVLDWISKNIWRDVRGGLGRANGPRPHLRGEPGGVQDLARRFYSDPPNRAERLAYIVHPEIDGQDRRRFSGPIPGSESRPWRWFVPPGKLPSRPPLRAHPSFQGLKWRFDKSFIEEAASGFFTRPPIPSVPAKGRSVVPKRVPSKHGSTGMAGSCCEGMLGALSAMKDAIGRLPREFENALRNALAAKREGPMHLGSRSIGSSYRPWNAFENAAAWARNYGAPWRRAALGDGGNPSNDTGRTRSSNVGEVIRQRLVERLAPISPVNEMPPGERSPSLNKQFRFDQGSEAIDNGYRKFAALKPDAALSSLMHDVRQIIRTLQFARDATGSTEDTAPRADRSREPWHGWEAFSADSTNIVAALTSGMTAAFDRISSGVDGWLDRFLERVWGGIKGFTDTIARLVDSFGLSSGNPLPAGVGQLLQDIASDLRKLTRDDDTQGNASLHESPGNIVGKIHALNPFYRS